MNDGLQADWSHTSSHTVTASTTTLARSITRALLSLLLIYNDCITLHIVELLERSPDNSPDALCGIAGTPGHYIAHGGGLHCEELDCKSSALPCDPHPTHSIAGKARCCSKIGGDLHCGELDCKPGALPCSPDPTGCVAAIAAEHCAMHNSGLCYRELGFKNVSNGMTGRAGC